MQNLGLYLLTGTVITGGPQAHAPPPRVKGVLTKKITFDIIMRDRHNVYEA